MDRGDAEATGSPYRVEVLRSMEEFESIGEDLDRVLRAQPIPQPFMTAAWLKTWVEHFSGMQGIWIVTVRRGRELVGLLPFCVRPRRLGLISFRSFEFIGAANAAWVGLIGDRDIGTVTGLMMRELLKNSDQWDFGVLQRMRNKNHVMVLDEQLKDVGFTVRTHPLVNIHGINVYTSGELFLASRKRHFIKNVKKHRRKMKECGIVGFSSYGSGSELEAAFGLGAIDEVVANSWQGKAGVSPFAQTNLAARQFHLDLIKQAPPDCSPIIHVLTFDGRPIAYRYGFLAGSHFTSYSIEYHKAHAAFALSHVLNYFSLLRLIDGGIRSIDFGVGEGSHKEDWGDWSETIYTIYFFHGGIRSSTYKVFHDLRGSAKHLWFKLRGNAPFVEEH